MSALTSAIRLVISGNSKGAVKALSDLSEKSKKTKDDLDKHSKALNTATKWGAAGVVAGAAIIAKAVIDYEAYGKSIRDVTRITDISTESASTLVGEWKRFGVDATAGANGVKFFNKNLDTARQGGAKQIEFFQRLGISINDLRMLDDSTLLSKTRDSLATMGPSAERTAIALGLMGRGGTAMMPWLNVAPGQMAEVNKQLEDAGLIWGDKELKQYADVAKAQKEMQIALAGISQTIARDVVPALTPFVRALGSMLRFMRPLAPVIVPATIALAGFVGVVKGAMLIQSTTGAVRGFYAAFKAGKLATAAGSLRNLTGLVRNLPALLAKGGVAFGVYGLVIAGVTTDIYLLIKAWNAYNDLQASDKQLVKATQDSTKADARAQAKIDAWKDAHPGQALPTGLQRLQDVVNQGKPIHLASKAQHVADKYWWQQFASGGDFITRGATPFIAGEGSEPERVTITPLSQQAKGGGRTVKVDLTVNASFIDMPSDGQLRRLTERIKQQIMVDVVPVLAGVNVG